MRILVGQNKKKDGFFFLYHQQYQGKCSFIIPGSFSLIPQFFCTEVFFLLQKHVVS